MIEMYLLEQLDAFARCGTLSGAAEQLHITQPALTRSMKKLEADMGVALFHRDKRRLILNPAGQVAAKYAARILADQQEMLDRAVAVDRQQRILTLGSCGVMTVNHLIPVLTQTFREKSILTEIAEDAVLLTRLKNRSCQLVVLHHAPEDPAIFAQRYLEEQIYISVPEDHPLAGKATLSAEDLAGIRMLAFDVGFWIPLFQKAMPETTLMVQTDADTMDELVDASALFVFNSDRMLQDGYIPEGRVNLRLSEDFARTAYYVACLDSEKSRYASFFSAIRADALGKN